MECRKCGTVNGDDYKFCKKCGAPLDVTETVCKSCGKQIEPDTAFCPYCGKAVSENTVQAAESKTEYGDVYAAAAQTKRERKPLVISNRGKFIATMTKAWVLTALFFLMFGLSFLSFFKYDVFGITDVKLSAVKFLELIFSKEMKNMLEGMEAVGYTAIIPCGILVFALMIGSFTFAVLHLVEALFLTVKGESALKKDISGLSLGIMTAIALFALNLTVGAPGDGPLSTMIIGIVGLVLNAIVNAAILGRRPVSVKKLVTQCVSLVLGITLLFTMTASHYGVKAKVPRTTNSEKVVVKVERDTYGIDTLIEGIDLYATSEDSAVYLGDTALEDVAERVLLRGSSSDNTDEKYLVLAPPFVFFYAEMNEGYNAAGLTLGILTIIGYFLMSISLCVMLAFIMISLSDFKQRTSFTSHLLALIGTLILLVTSIVCVAAASGVVASLELLFNIYICAAPIVNTVLALGLFVQNAILGRREKIPAKN